MTVEIERELPLILAPVEVRDARQVSRSFMRVELGGPALADFGVAGPLYDQRIKIVFPNTRGALPALRPTQTWYADWLALPDDERGVMRTYTIREVHGSGTGTRLVVDFVLHAAPGHEGPGSSWAAGACPGDRVLVAAPRRGHEYGGVEFAPGAARELLLVADETAVPALGGVLRDLAPDARGVAFAEVPTVDDVLPLAAPAGVQVRWLPREGMPHGMRQVGAVRRHLGLPPATGLVDDGLVDPDLWETPTYSSRNEPITTQERETALTGGLPDVYAWIAGESKVVTTLRRFLVAEVGLHRSQVAFMGYWRRGVAMRS